MLPFSPAGHNQHRDVEFLLNTEINGNPLAKGQPSLQFFRFPRFLRVQRRRVKSAGHSKTAALHIEAPKYAMAEQQFSTVAPPRWLLKKSKESQPSSKSCAKGGEGDMFCWFCPSFRIFRCFLGIIQRGKSHPKNHRNIWLWINTFKYFFLRMNIHLPSMLVFVRALEF